MTPVLRLEPFTAAHLPAFTVLARDPDVLRFTRFPDPPQDAFPVQWLARYEAGRADGTKEAFAILGADGEPELLGVALAVEIDRAARAAEPRLPDRAGGARARDRHRGPAAADALGP